MLNTASAFTVLQDCSACQFGGDLHHLRHWHLHVERVHTASSIHHVDGVHASDQVAEVAEVLGRSSDGVAGRSSPHLERLWQTPE